MLHLKPSSMLLCLGFTLLFACNNTPVSQQSMSTEKFYKRDMIINGYEGVVVLPKQESYDFHVEARGDLDLFVMKTVSKEETKERAWNVTQTVKNGLFGWGTKKIDKPREVTFSYRPSAIELSRNSIVELGGYAVANGRHSWAFIAFEDPDTYALQATISCNGRDYVANGVSICQSHEQLFQSIKFSSAVEIAGTSQCGITGQGDYRIQKGRCVVIFKEKATGKLHKHITVGYDAILLRN